MKHRAKHNSRDVKGVVLTFRVTEGEWQDLCQLLTLKKDPQMFMNNLLHDLTTQAAKKELARMKRAARKEGV